MRTRPPSQTPATGAEEKAYHHGSLRSTLVEAARRILETDGYEALTLRSVARESGVSRQAPYHHFADKSALLAGVAANGFLSLREAMLSAMAAFADPWARLTASGVAYVTFALSNPALFRLMFGGSGESFARDEDMAVCRNDAFGVLTDAIAAVGAVAAEDIPLKALAAWSIVHGLAELINKGAVPAPRFDTDEAEAFITGVLVTGLKI
jgi:AcrR family transcriptional regulator